MKILLVEDNISIRNVLRMSLEAQSFAIDEAPDGESGSYLARTNEYDLIILDNVLPKKMGGHVCKEIRDEGITTPIIMLSAKSDVLDKVRILDLGADDYITKPFSFEELLSRMKAVLRRPTQIQETILCIESIILNCDTQRVSKNDKDIYLTRKEFSLLEFLLKNKDRVISRAQIMEHVWDINANPFSNTIEAHILSLRKKIGDTKKRLIQNVPGRGYRIST